MKDLSGCESLLRDAARRMREYADSVDKKADRLVEKGDLEYMAFALNEIVNMQQNLRLDLFVSRSIRAIQFEDREQ